MPPKRDDVAFGYDPRPFMRGLNTVTQGLGNLTKKVTQVAGQITRRFLLIGVAFKAAQALWRQFNKHVPEFGKAFSIAGDIFFKNLFWPLRTMLVPMLQKMLDWVRDHRTMFIRWGQTLANVLRGVIGLGKQLVGIFKMIVDSLGPAFKRVFGGSFQDFLNVVTVKLAVALEFVGRLVKTIFAGLQPYLGPIVENIMGFAKAIWDLVSGFLRANDEGNSLFTVLRDIAEFAGKAVEFITRLAKEFAGGFATGLKDAMTPLGEIVKQFRELLDLIVGADDKTHVLSNTFRTLGQLLGAQITAALVAVWATLTGIKNAIIITIKAIGVLSKIGKPGAGQAQAELTAALAAAGAEFGDIGAFLKKWGGGQLGAFKQTWGIGEGGEAGGRAPLVQPAPATSRGAEKFLKNLGPVTINFNVNGTMTPAQADDAARKVKEQLLLLQTAGAY